MDSVQEVSIHDIESLYDRRPLEDILIDRLSEEVLGIKPPHILLTVGAPNQSEVGSDTESISCTYSFSGKQEDINKVKEIIDAIRSNSLNSVSDVKFNSTISVDESHRERSDEPSVQSELEGSPFEFFNQIPQIIDAIGDQ